MLYLMDANALITAKNQYYPILRFPNYWDWLVHAGTTDKLKVPLEIYREFSASVKADGKKDELAAWASQKQTRQSLIYAGPSDKYISEVLVKGYGHDLSEDDLLEIGKDPYLISSALNDPQNSTVVTCETSASKRTGRNRRIPDACKDLGVRCIDPHKMICELDFYYHWKT